MEAVPKRYQQHLIERIAVVTGGNKGIGFATVKQLASSGIKVVLAARDEKRGLQAVEELRNSGFSELVTFHQLDVTDPSSIASFADSLKTQFGKLDILVNNAGVLGTRIHDSEVFHELLTSNKEADWSEKMTQTYELAEECVKTNYYGPKQVTEALLPLLQLSDSPRIVNVSSGAGKLMLIPSNSAKEILGNIESLTEEKIDEILSEFLKDYKEGMLESKGWPLLLSAYIVSKAALNAYTRLLANKYNSNYCINCLCPGYVKTDINHNTGDLTIDEGADSIVRLAKLPNGGPTGLYFIRQEVSPF